MAQLSSEERIARVEQAPIEMQTKVAKAFIRDDIDDEDVQYLFNEDSVEEMNEEDVEIENLGAEEPEDGIGASMFEMRTAKPKAGNKNYITTGSGGWNTCIKGKPTDAACDALANCVGYASGRFNEIINELLGTTGCTYKTLNCNASGFIDRAIKAGLQVGETPKVGAIGCCGGGRSGAGHVFIVEAVYSNNKIYTSESGYNSSKMFWNATRTNTNGRWGMNTNYTFKGFIYLPDEVQKIIDGPLPEITPTVERDITKNQLETLREMNVRVGIETTSKSLGMVPTGSIYNYYNAEKGKHSMWYAITQDSSQWIAGVNDDGTKYCNIYPAETPSPVQPEPTPATPVLKVGDKVKIIGTGNGSSYGTSNTAYGIGWTRQILKIWDGRPYPYQVGNNTGTTGYYKAEALQKK